MIALHVSIVDGVPFLWGETCVDRGKEAGKTLTGCSVYPFDPGIRGLRDALQRLATEFKVLKSNTGQGVVWLPARGGVPVPSAPLLGPAPDRRHKQNIGSFTTTVRQLSLAELLELTALAVSPAVAGIGVIFGPSFVWCDHLLKLALAVGIQEAFLPTLIRGAEQWEARWLPVPDETTQQQIADLAACMPGSCRCLSYSPDAPPETPPLLTANRLLARCLDGLVRRANTPEAGDVKRRPRHVSLHDAWLAALASPVAAVVWPNEADLKEFSAQLSHWQRPVDLTAQSPFRFCFRLFEPPTGDAAEWQLDYLLQAKADPSLLVAVSDLWKPRSQASQQMQKFGGQPTEFLLTALGQAAGLCPAVAASLKGKHPGGFPLDTDGAFIFLRDQAEALRGAGFTVMLPSWWVGRGPTKRLGLKIQGKSPKMQGSGSLSLEAMVDFNFTASLVGEPLSLTELHALARLKAPLVQVRGQWTQIDPEQIKTALRFLENRQHQPLSARDLLAMALGAERQFDGLPVDAVETDGWLQEVLEKLTGRQEFAAIEQPQGLTGQLRPYQQRGYSWLAFLRQWGLGACLADDMGLGKTVQTLALIEGERAAGETRPVLLLCPTTVVNNWRKEAEKFTPGLRIHIHHGSDRHRKKDFAAVAAQHNLVVSSYGLLQRDHDFLQEVAWAGIILDEAQNIKNPEAKQSRAARAMHADYRIALTGTPVENHVGDLWALMDFLNPGLLGSQNAFKQHFFRPIQIWRDADRAAQLKRLTGPFLLRRLKTDRIIISDLPEKIEAKEFCTLSREQASLYAAVLEDMQARLENADGIERRGLVLATLSKLKQVCNHPAHFIGDGSPLDGRSGKLARLKEMLTELYELKERTLVFTQYAEMGGLLQQYFQEQFGQEVFFLHGGVSRKRRDEMVERFQNDEQAPLLFILSLKAGGTGLTLTRANHVVHYDRWWNPAVENQATDRAFRIGQQRNVQVHKFLVAGTLEERIDEMIEFKSGIAGEIVGTGEQWLTELSNDDLRDLLKLGSEAVGD